MYTDFSTTDKHTHTWYTSEGSDSYIRIYTILGNSSKPNSTHNHIIIVKDETHKLYIHVFHTITQHILPVVYINWAFVSKYRGHRTLTPTGDSCIHCLSCWF